MASNFSQFGIYRLVRNSQGGYTSYVYKSFSSLASAKACVSRLFKSGKAFSDLESSPLVIIAHNYFLSNGTIVRYFTSDGVCISGDLGLHEVSQCHFVKEV